jgi:hypothetical protein
MAAIRLLPAPVEPPSALELRSQSTGLVLAPRLALASRPVTSRDTAYRNDGDVWSVSVGDDGTFNFYASPPKNTGNSAAGQKNDFQSARATTSSWNTLQMRNAAAQYALHANMPAQTYGHFVDLYA